MIDLGNLPPLSPVPSSLAAWEQHVRIQPFPDTDPVALTLGSVRQQLTRTLTEELPTWSSNSAPRTT